MPPVVGSTDTGYTRTGSFSQPRSTVTVSFHRAPTCSRLNTPLVSAASRSPGTAEESNTYGTGIPSAVDPSGFTISTAPGVCGSVDRTGVAPCTSSQNDHAAAPVPPGAAATTTVSFTEDPSRA